MGTDHTTLAALKFVTGDNTNICRLCFAVAEKKQYCLRDCVTLGRPYFNDAVSFLDMFRELGVSESQPSDILCSGCANMTINSFLFKKLSIYSDEKWQQALDLLLQTLPSEDSFKDKMQTTFLILKKNADQSFAVRTSAKIKDKAAALAKIKKVRNKKKKSIYETTICDNGTTIYESFERSPVMTCEECGIQFFTMGQLKHHMKSHKNSSNPKCSQCFKTFSSPFLLSEHIRRIHDPKVLQCAQCAKMFSTESLLKHHIKQRHVEAICKLCFIQFPSKTALRHHMDKHEISKCSQCNKEFQGAQSLRRHLKICGDTSSDPQFFCDICGKGYKRKHGIRGHMQAEHSFGKSHKCKWCGKNFDVISKLNYHIVKHTRERNFYCEHCGSKFVTKPALLYHIRLHTGERPYPCDMCDEKFLSASRRMEHKRRKHMGPTRECTICHAKFVSGHSLRIHIRRHYNPSSKLYMPEISANNNIKEIDEHEAE